uniref:ORF4 n=1 Tax=Nitrosopumilaceae spindle-shaped virus TaxID=3065433 RepID=A0AAT9J7F2_9VIRU
MRKGGKGGNKVSLLAGRTAVRCVPLCGRCKIMAGRNYELYSYCNGCTERPLKQYSKDMLRCPACNQKLRHKPKSCSAKKTAERYYAHL